MLGQRPPVIPLHTRDQPGHILPHPGLRLSPPEPARDPLVYPVRAPHRFDKICRKNGINRRLTAPASPNQNGKVERFRGTFRPDFLGAAGPFTSLEQAQAAVDTW